MTDKFDPPPPPYLPNLIVALIASVGIVIGSLGPWLTSFAVERNAIDGDGRITLAAGVLSVLALFAVFNLGRSRTNPDWRSVNGWNRQMTRYVIALMNNEEASK